MQLTMLPGLARGGATRLQIEAVRLAPSVRGSGRGTALFDWPPTLFKPAWPIRISLAISAG